MIITQEANLKPMTFTGGVFKRVFEVVTREGFINPTFDFDTGECDYTEAVFAEVGGDDFKNDKRNFLVSLVLASDTVTFFLFKDGVELATIVDDTFGIFSPIGTFPTQPLKATFFADFEKIFDLEGAGCYEIKADRIIITAGSTLSSIPYRLMPYSAIGARNTIKIQSFQNGQIEGGIDYTGINFEQQVRVLADLTVETPDENIENYRDTLQSVEQIQDSVTDKYKFRTRGIPTVISNQIIKDMLLGNSVRFTNYDVFVDVPLIDVPVFKSEIVEFTKPLGQSLGFLEVILENRGRIRKRN